MARTQYEKDSLFHKRMARVTRLNAGGKCPTDRRQRRRAVRILALGHLYLAEGRPGLDQGVRVYRRAMSRL